jgi:hypothetical protein
VSADDFVKSGIRPLKDITLEEYICESSTKEAQRLTQARTIKAQKQIEEIKSLQRLSNLLHILRSPFGDDHDMRPVSNDNEVINA